MLEMSMAMCPSLQPVQYDGVRFEPQRSNNDCLVIAAINACHYLGIAPPDYDAMIQLAERRTQQALNETLAMTGLEFEEAYNDQIVEHGVGIMVIEPKPRAPHAVFAFTADGKLHLVNSNLSPDLVVTIDPSEIPQARYPENKGWILKLPEVRPAENETTGQEGEAASPKSLLSALRLIAAASAPAILSLHNQAVELCCASARAFYLLREQGGMFQAPEEGGESQLRPEMVQLRQALLHATGIDPLLVPAEDFFTTLGCSPAQRS